MNIYQNIHDTAKGVKFKFTERNVYVKNSIVSQGISKKKSK